jgi:hypothetical protein
MFCDFFMTFYLRRMMQMYLQKNSMVTDEKSRFRIRLVRGIDPRIRIRTKMSWIRNTAFTSGTQYGTDLAHILVNINGGGAVLPATRLLSWLRLSRLLFLLVKCYMLFNYRKYVNGRVTTGEV